jgi:hypothetical protein
VKLVLCLTKHHAVKSYWYSGGVTLRIFNLGTRWKSVVSFTLRPLYPRGKKSRYQLDRSLGGRQGLSGRGVEEKQVPSGK